MLENIISAACLDSVWIWNWSIETDEKYYVFTFGNMNVLFAFSDLVGNLQSSVTSPDTLLACR